MVGVREYKRCPNCFRVLRREAYHSAPSRYDGLDWLCIECRQSPWGRLLHRAYDSNSRASHFEGDVSLPFLGRITAVDLMAKMVQQNFSCPYCYEDIDRLPGIAVHHIQHMSKDGLNIRHNIAIVDKSCNGKLHGDARDARPFELAPKPRMFSLADLGYPKLWSPLLSDPTVLDGNLGFIVSEILLKEGARAA